MGLQPKLDGSMGWRKDAPNMNRKNGVFIVLEGLDGSGTTTQAKRLHQTLIERGLSAHPTFEPTDEPVGKLIRDALSGKIISARTDQKFDFTESALALLFAADRIEHSRWIEEQRTRGVHVVCDRYILSSIAYQSLDPDITPERVIELNWGCSVPDVTFLLSVSADECIGRLEQRKDSPTVYEKRDTLERIARNYEATRALYEGHFGPFITIDGAGSPEDVHAAIMSNLSVYLPW
jgi:dTMP kinase